MTDPSGKSLNSSAYEVASFTDIFFNYCVSGINFSLPGNGGQECHDFIDQPRRSYECIFGILVSIGCLILGIKLHKPPGRPRIGNPFVYDPWRIALLVSMTFVFAMELCYKLATRQAIFILQPCHILCLIMMFLLAAPATNSRALTYLFRVHIYFLHGPIVAIIFPVTNTLFLPFEVSTYWLEHFFLMIIPLYLLRQGGVFTMEKTMDLTWPLMSFGIWGIYHFIILEFMSLFTMANLNSMLCPAITDPFYGPNYRLYALGHQFALNFLSGKLFGLLGKDEVEQFEELPKKLRHKSS